MPLSQLRKAQLLSGSFTKLMAENEAVLSDLYLTFSQLLPKARDFWLTLSKEETGHIRIIEILEEKLQKGELSFKRPDSAHAQLADSVRTNCRHMARAEEQGISMCEALKIALKIESSMLEADFFEIIKDDSEEASKALSDLEHHTRVHRDRIEKESKKLKWRILGRCCSDPLPEQKCHEEPHIDTSAEIKAQVTLSQAEVLDLAIELEEQSNRLYKAYSKRAPEMKEFWEKIAAEEMQHAHLLKTLENMLEKGTVFYNVGRFRPQDLQKDIDFIMNAETKAQSDDLSVLDLIMTASLVEKMMLECSFYQTVDSDSPEYKIIAERLVDHTKEHIRNLDEEAKKVMMMGADARTPLPSVSSAPTER